MVQIPGLASLDPGYDIMAFQVISIVCIFLLFLRHFYAKMPQNIAKTGFRIVTYSPKGVL
jgi:hypothetical protein